MSEALASIYENMDSTDQQALYDFALFLVSRPKYKENKDTSKRVEAAKSLFGILPPTASLDEAKEARTAHSLC